MGLARACTRATAAAAVLRVSSPQVAALREMRARLARQIQRGAHTSSTASTNGALTIAPVGHSLGWRESVGRVARTRQVVALKSSSRLVLPGLEGESLVDGALRGGR